MINKKKYPLEVGNDLCKTKNAHILYNCFVDLSRRVVITGIPPTKVGDLLAEVEALYWTRNHPILHSGQASETDLVRSIK